MKGVQMGVREVVKNLHSAGEHVTTETEEVFCEFCETLAAYVRDFGGPNISPRGLMVAYLQILNLFNLPNTVDAIGSIQDSFAELISVAFPDDFAMEFFATEFLKDFRCRK